MHTVLSPCGDLYMSPSAIVEQANKLHLDVIAICDHNTTRQVKVTQKIGRENGILVIGGVEITTQEEAHALAYFETDEQLDKFQEFLDEHLPHIPLDEEKFGYQLIVDENEEVVGDEEWLAALKGPAYSQQAPTRRIAWRAKYMCKSFVAQYLGSDYTTAERVFCLSGGKEIKDLKFTNISKNSDVCDEQTGKIAEVIRKAIRFVD